MSDIFYETFDSEPLRRDEISRPLFYIEIPDELLPEDLRDDPETPAENPSDTDERGTHDKRDE